jgi:hypothetical protein
MIRIQKLKEPKKTSGKKVESGKAHLFHGIEILNKNKYPVYVDFYQRKKPKPKTEKTRTK